MNEKANEAITDKDEDLNIDAAEKEETEVVDSGEKENVESAEDLKKEIARLQKENEDIYGQMLRVQAEFDNFKKRSQKEKEASLKYKSQDIVNELLPAIDNFERALQVEVTDATASLIEGITMVYNQLKEALKSQGVEEIEAVGKEFDPNLHHGVMQVEEEEFESNIIVEELQKGYILKDRVIRPAMVKVNK
ncbi:molecular chaperone GrpE [Virgibacillus campisalis]|uniref:Protein GrpE n=2 Tax=Virgibacillus alimentarius TaxID=698769 RepID=A0ABS4S4Y6_9BACI|nr:molecular chaperone GrpE [Virgibacillus alimentarius]